MRRDRLPARPGDRRAAELEEPLAALFAAWDRALAPDDVREVVLARYLMGWANALVEDRGGAVQQRMARRAVAVFEPRADALPYDLAEARALLALCAHRRGDRGAASDHARSCMELMRRRPPRDSWWNTVARVRIARCLVALQWFEEAEAILLSSREVIGAQLGEGHTESAETRRLLAALYRAWGRPEQAAKYATD